MSRQALRRWGQRRRRRRWRWYRPWRRGWSTSWWALKTTTCQSECRATEVNSRVLLRSYMLWYLATLTGIKSLRSLSSQLSVGRARFNIINFPLKIMCLVVNTICTLCVKIIISLTHVGFTLCSYIKFYLKDWLCLLSSVIRPYC